VEEYRTLSVDFSYLISEVLHQGSYSVSYTNNNLMSDWAGGDYLDEDGEQINWENHSIVNAAGLFEKYEQFINGELSVSCEEYQWDNYLLKSLTCTGLISDYSDVDVNRQIKTYTYNTRRQITTINTQTYWSNGNLYRNETKKYFQLKNYLPGFLCKSVTSIEEYDEDGGWLYSIVYDFQDGLPIEYNYESSTDSTQ